jgi:hypothetical protein
MERHKPKKHKNPVKAIREMCIECMGGRDSEGYAKRISECPVPVCSLFEYRLGKNPNHTKNLTDEQRKKKAETLKKTLSHDKASKKVA